MLFRSQIADERQYVQLASNLASGQGFRLDPARLTSMRPPLYPFVVAGVFTLAGGEDLQAVRAAQVLIGLLVVVATYALSLRMFGARVALVAAAVTCFYPSLVFSGLLLLTELLFTLLVLLFVLAYDRTVETRSTWFALGAGVALGCSALTRSVLWPFPIEIGRAHV